MKLYELRSHFSVSFSIRAIGVPIKGLFLFFPSFCAVLSYRILCKGYEDF